MTPARTVYPGDDGVSSISMEVEKDVDSSESGWSASSHDHVRGVAEAGTTTLEEVLELPHMGHEYDEVMAEKVWYHGYR